ncbi:MAG: PD40 domain-containing protein [Haliscomenobacter sp.]|nr:PD40 domain-containing protein [Haliscomenobacter sp.]MBP9076338.1 PD40 domain-containing protein [Haliscomenobacter sp.]MBP9874461.1 PD40 domain-containing protein [Haliscomenobacter sp.]
MRISYALFSMIFLFSVVLVRGQETLVDKKRQAKEFFINAHFQDAYNVLQTAQKNHLEDKESNFLMALSLYHLNRLNEAETILLGLLSDRSPYAETWLYLGRIFQDRNEFLKATDYYKAFLKTLSSDDPNRNVIRDEIRRCSNGLQWQFRAPMAIVENLGPQINTPYDEFGPLTSPNAVDRLYFSSARPGCSGGQRNRYGAQDDVFGRFTCDIFSAQLVSGQWKNPVGMSYLINTPKHEIALDFAPSGRAMYYFKGSQFSEGQIFVDTFRSGGNNVLSTDPLLSPLDAVAGMSAPHFVNDTLILFPSSRPGGYGGLDLYRTVFRNGRWTAPQNLGPEINSAFDETTPFLARDGKSIYYSSNNPNLSIGGFDILKSVFNTHAGKWSTSANLGIPINSSRDETHFRLSRDGYTAFFASSRKDGLGERDLYAAYFFDFLPEMSTLAEVSPTGSSSPTGPSAVRGGNSSVLTIQPLFFDKEEEALSSNTTGQLDVIAQMLLQNPKLQLVLTGYSQVELAVSSRLFAGVKAAKVIADYLLKRGVSPSSLRVRGALSPDMETALKGVDLRLIPPPGSKDPEPSYGPSIGSAPATSFYSKLTYRLLIAESSVIYRGALLAQLENPITELKSLPEGNYLYLAGNFNTYAEAKAAQAKFGPSAGFAVQVIPFARERWLKKEDAYAYTTQYPDLVQFLNDK